MLIAAAIIFVITAYYFGIRAGGWAAGAVVALILASVVMPSKALWIYAIIGIGFFAILTVGPRQRSKQGKVDVLSGAHRAWKRYRKWRNWRK